MFKFLMLFSGFALIGCVKIKDIPKEPGPESPPAMPAVEEPPATMTEPVSVPASESFETPTVMAEIVELPEANSYQVRLKSNLEMVSVRKWNRNTPQNVEEVSDNPASEEILDTRVEANTDYIYEVHFSEGSPKQIEFSVPVDLDVKGEITLEASQDWHKYRRLFLYPHSAINTLNYDLKLSVQKIVSNGGVIRSFPPGSKSPQGVTGLTGGHIQIESWSGEGMLRIECRGAHGGNGADAKSQLDNGESGQPGGNSCSGSLKMLGEHSLKLQVQMEAGSGGAGGRAMITDFDCGRPGRLGVLGICRSGKSGQKGSDGEVREFCFLDRSDSDCRKESWSN